jgi:hypothetical protein
MSLRVILYAEGTLETGASMTMGELLDESTLGPAHVLVRRVLVSVGRAPEAAIRFARPLRLASGREARGSDLLKGTSLRKLLAWPPGAAPNVVIILVDADGDPQRRSLLARKVNALLRPVIAVAVEEFEAWLVADEHAVSCALGVAFERTPDPEGMRPGEAKATLVAALAAASADPAARKTIAAICDLDVVAARCPSFERFRADLRASA